MVEEAVVEEDDMQIGMRMKLLEEVGLAWMEWGVASLAVVLAMASD